MLDAIETVLLIILPWSFVAKSLAIGVMWWRLGKHTTPSGPLGIDINKMFRDQFFMSVLITWAMFILYLEVDATEIDWPFVTIALAGLALWPIPTAIRHYRVWLTYRRIARERKKRSA